MIFISITLNVMLTKYNNFYKFCSYFIIILQCPYYNSMFVGEKQRDHMDMPNITHTDSVSRLRAETGVDVHSSL